MFNKLIEFVLVILSILCQECVNIINMLFMDIGDIIMFLF